MIRHALRLSVITLAFVGAACGQTGEETAGCKPTSFTEVGVDEITPLGFSAADALANVEGTRDFTLTWANSNPPTNVTVDLVRNGGTIDFITYEFDAGDGNMEIAADDCYDILRIPVNANVSTADGALSESRAHFVDARAVDRAIYWEDWDSEELSGTLDIEDFTEEAWDRTWASVWIDFNGGTIGAELYGLGELTQGGGDDGIAVAGRFDIATWGASLQ